MGCVDQFFFLREVRKHGKQGCIMSPWLFNEYVDAGMKEVKMEIGRIGMRFLEGERGVEIAWPLLCR